jgi:hypothetical protein
MSSWLPGCVGHLKMSLWYQHNFGTQLARNLGGITDF